ncbi:hypothetical protein [uncultured Litoreibacter sp.]|uniref:nucleoside triphosphate pyrophosphohydrolase n=1 Tax=uncultured Litoreibacter sp. TaxID=1392394 RepID=UPI002609796A|nr:hypothetical protein [uncultured Litoreibacter sp.]
MFTLEKVTKSKFSDFSDFGKVSQRFGAKAAGLTTLPSQWTPEFRLIRIDFHKNWLETGELEAGILQEVADWQVQLGEDVIVRSSGVNETIDDRGKYRSIIISAGHDALAVSDAIIEIFDHAQTRDPNDRLGLIIQKHVPSEFTGHLSNERRLKTTRNQWDFEFEKPSIGRSTGIDSTRIEPWPDDVKMITGKSSSEISKSMRRLGNWATKNLPERTHFEWLICGTQLWVVQADFEWPEHDNGIDPTNFQLENGEVSLDFHATTLMEPYKVGTLTKWKKLKNLSDFDFDDVEFAPKIFHLKGETVESSINDQKKSAILINELRAVTADRAVVRTESCDQRLQAFNMPRTDTCSAADAVEWCQKQILAHIADGIAPKDVAFFCHAFLPARAAAWAYASPDRKLVFVDALWGLPDGLQYWPTDTYEVAVDQAKIIQTKTVFKPKFLAELGCGTWDYQNVKKSKARSQVLSRSDILEVASRTHNIAKKLGEEAQIMWFCGIPDEYRVGQNLPWFRSRELFEEEAPRSNQSFRDFTIKVPADLGNLPQHKVCLVLAPDAELVRNDHFLNLVADKALEKDLPIKFFGSRLGHAYYRLVQKKVKLILPNSARYKRTRDRRQFGKLVRDKIPEMIRNGGEEASEGILQSPEILFALAGKMFEEVEEFLEAEDKVSQIAELSDIYELLRAMAHHCDIEWEEVVSSANSKREKRGGFEERKILLETSLPKGENSSTKLPMVSLKDLLEITEGKSSVQIPLGALSNLFAGQKFQANFDGDASRFTFSIIQGKLEITRTQSKDDATKSNQGDLFN